MQPRAELRKGMVTDTIIAYTVTPLLGPIPGHPFPPCHPTWEVCLIELEGRHRKEAGGREWQSSPQFQAPPQFQGEEACGCRRGSHKPLAWRAQPKIQIGQNEPLVKYSHGQSHLRLLYTGSFIIIDFFLNQLFYFAIFLYMSRSDVQRDLYPHPT